MYLVLFLSLAIVPSSFCYEDIHEYMSPEEVQQVFHTEADAVPEYEIVKLDFPDRLHKRELPSGSHFHLRAFGEDINLWLHPRDSILAGVDTPVYYAKQTKFNSLGVEFTRRDGLMKMVGKIYEDPYKMASLVIGQEDDGRARINGHIESDRLVIKSLPKRIADEYRKRRSVDDLENSSYHVVLKSKYDLDEAYSLPPMNQTSSLRTASKLVDKVPDTLYPEVLVVVDYNMYKTFDTERGHDIYRLLEYLLAFWNGVDLKYRSLESPRFRLNIAGIVLSEDPNATPYISRSMVTNEAFNETTALSRAHRFYYDVRDTFPLGSVDVVVVMTRLKIGVDDSGTILGVALTGTICRRNDDHHYFDAVTFSRDEGDFLGVHVVAHEMGHIFGSRHDSESSDCTTSNGFLMAFTPWYTTNSSDFSSCSMKQFQAKLENGKYTCLYNKPKYPGISLPKIMPGRMHDIVEQCKNEGLGAPCRNSTDSICVNYFCLENNGECRETGKAALDGTACEGENKFCLHEQCISL